MLLGHDMVHSLGHFQYRKYVDLENWNASWLRVHPMTYCVTLWVVGSNYFKKKSQSSKDMQVGSSGDEEKLWLIKSHDDL